MDTKMKELCRICARELCGNQRRWIFHTASRLNLQVILSHVLGREISRDGKAEFACSKCVFMLDRIYRFDTVIARIEALSIERLQKLLNEKDRLKQCIANLFQRNNEDHSLDGKSGNGTVDVSYLPDMHYSALLQEDFAYSGLESWVEDDEQGAEALSCHHFIDSGSQKPRRCRTCAALRVTDADYEAVCKIPRKLARSASSASRYSASTVGSVCSEETPGIPTGSESLAACLSGIKDSGSDGGVEKMSPIMSVESLDKVVETSPLSIKEEEEGEILAVEDEDAQVDMDREIKQDQRSDTFFDDPATINSSVYFSKLELALSMVKNFDLRPVKSPKGSKLPILERCSPLLSKSDSAFASEVSQADTRESSDVQNRTAELVSRQFAGFHPALADLEELWQDVCEGYVPLRFRVRQKNLVEEQQMQLNQYETAAGQCMTELQKAEQQVHLLQSKIHETEASNRILQEKLSEMELELKSVRQGSRKQDRSIQGLSEALASKQKEIEELYGVLEGQSESMDKLREIIQRGSLSQLQGPDGPLSVCLLLPQQSEFSDQQNSLLATQLELQKTRRLLRRRDYQVADTQRAQGLLEAELQEMRQQQNDILKHGQELRGMLQHTRAELQEKELLLRAAEREKLSEIEDREKAILQLNQNLREKEHLIQECEGLFQNQTSDGSMAGRDVLLEKLRERIRDRDRALERAIDEKYSALEEKERETRKLQLALREKERDLERLRCVLSNNEETINSLDGLVKVKDLELEQASLALQNLQRLKQETDERSERTLQEKDRVLARLHEVLQAKNMEVENVTAALINRVSLGANEVAQQLRISLLEKEKLLGNVLEENRKQMAEHECEIHGLLAIVTSRDQQLKESSERLVQLIAEKYHEVQDLRRQIAEREKEVTDLIKSKNPSSPGLMTETCRLKRLLEVKERFIDELMQESPVAQAVPERMTNGRGTEGSESYEAAEKASELHRELDNVKEELQFALRKENEARLELSNLQSVIDEQSKEIQLQTANIEALGKNQKAQQDLIKELQVRMSKPEELALVEHLTQEVLALKERAAQMESSSLDDSDLQHHQSVLEILLSEQARLNEALETEMQLYNSLVKFHANPDSNERDRKLQEGLDIIRALQSQLEDGLRRSQMSLSRLDRNQGTLVNFGELGIEGEEEDGDEEDDRSSQFTDSIEEDALSKERHCRESNEQVSFSLGQNILPGDTENDHQSPDVLDSAEDLHRQLLELEAEFQTVQEQKDRAEEELQKIKAQIEESGFSSLAQIRSTLLSLHLENTELKERVGDVGVGQWEREENEKEEVEDLNEEDLREAFRKLKAKQENAEMVIGLLKEQLDLNLSVNGEKRFDSELIVNMAKEIQRLRSDLSSLHGKRSAPGVQLRQGRAKRQCTRPHSLDLGVLLSGANSKPETTESGADGQSQSQGFWQHVESGLREQLQTLRLDLAQCRQQKQELQDQLMVTEATVQAQGSQLKQYRRLLVEPSVEQDSKQVQVDLQDLGYETCGRSENEAEREEASSPECAETELQGDFENDHCIFELNPQYDFAITSSPWPLKSSMKKQHQLEEYGKTDDITVLQQHIQDLKTQLKNSEKVIRNLQARIRSFSTTSDYASSMERPSKIMKNTTFQASPSPSIADEDEGWQSDSFGDIPNLKIKPSKELAELVERVASLEAQLKKSRLEQSIPEQLRSATWPGKYDSLVQAQARELSHIRQKSREGRGLCHILTQHLQDTTKAFEELLRANDIDYYMGQSFRDQLAQGSQLVERISAKLSARDRTNIDDKAGHELVALRLSRELQQKDKVIESLRAKLQEHFETSSSLALSESDQSDRTSFVSDDRASTNDELELCSNVDSTNDYAQSERRGRDSVAQDHEEHHSHTESTASLSSVPSSITALHGTPAKSSPSIPSSLHHTMDTHLSQQGVGQTAPTGMKLMPGSAGLSTDSCNSSQTDFSHGVGSGPLPHLPFLQSQFNSSFSSDGMPKMDSGFLDNTGLWDMAHLVQTPRMNVFGDKSSGSSAYQSGASLSGTDLLEEHLGEIRNLRQRLEESIRTNDRLREQLEERLASAVRGNGPPTNIYIQGLESVSQLSNENRVLLEEKMNLQTQLSQLSRGHSAELEQLRESLMSARSKMKNLEVELEKCQEENRRVQADMREKQQEVVQLREERQHCQENNNRLQHEVSLLQQQMAENRQLICSLQTEVHLYERLCGVTKPSTPAYLRDGGLHGVSSTFDLKSLLSEVRSLRLQLEHSIQLNSSLRQQLEQQLTGNAGKEQRPSCISIFPTSELGSRKEVYQDSVPSPPVRDTGPFTSAFPACSSSTPSFAELAMEDSLLQTQMVNCAKDSANLSSSKLEGDAPDGTFANKNGRHVIGHIDDYTALQQQVMEGKVLVHKMETLMQSALNIPFLEIHGTKGLDYGKIKQLFANTNTLGQILKEASSLLKMFWRAALPSISSSTQHLKKEKTMKEEIHTLRHKLAEMESLLHNATERLSATNQVKESMEQFIVGQLTRTHDVLKKARTNLEKGDCKGSLFKSCPSPGKGDEITRDVSEQTGHVTELFQQPSKKKSNRRSVLKKEGRFNQRFVEVAQF
ncbi:myomegalin isoform X3 [Protopterus annectens]|uniref:myomegalin isoform X3 n=1 Tax=Protopterus annectens TaxID=7888 RepID=UPI001CFB362F|nr:myomegalin isoform X3 [Protopterus annectens]